MTSSWYNTMMLAVASNNVIGLRLMKIAGGGTNASDEIRLMVSEKIDAAIEAGTTLMAGGTTAAVIDRYREHVDGNVERLSRPAS